MLTYPLAQVRIATRYESHTYGSLFAQSACVSNTTAMKNGADGSFGPSAHINNIRVLYTLNVNLGSYFMVRVSYLWICFCLTALVLFKEGYKTTNQDAK